MVLFASKGAKLTAAASKREVGIQVREDYRRRCRIATPAAVAAAAAAARQLVHVPRARVVDRHAGKIIETPCVSASTSTSFGVGAGEDELPPATRSSLLVTNSFWEVVPLLMSPRYLGIPSVPPAKFAMVLLDQGVWCVSLRAWMRGANAPRDDVTKCGGTGLMSYGIYRSVRNRVDVMLNVQVSGTAIDVVPIPVPAPVQTSIPVPSIPYRAHRFVRHRY